MRYDFGFDPKLRPNPVVRSTSFFFFPAGGFVM
jgi:hypothetical protein